tara:strand:- start:330 stop:1331 length:1002 start_codon:yes stop_codon:yes gene_type:complete
VEKKKATKTYIKVRKGNRPRFYTNVSNQLIQSEDLSFRAKGLLVYFMSLSESFFVSPEVIANTFKLGKHAYYQTINELKEQGYLEHLKLRDEQGRIIGAEYVVHEEPINQIQDSVLKNASCSQDPNYPVSDYQVTDYQDLDNQDSAYPDRAEQEPEKQTLYNYKYNKIKNKKTNNSKDAADVIIRNELTLNQLNAIRQEINSLSHILPYDEEKLFNDIVITILDPDSFSRSEGIFYKKLNSILKVIKQGKWQPPAKQLLEQEKQKQTRLEQLERELSECVLEVVHWQKLKKMHENKGDELQIRNCEELITKFIKIKKTIELEIKKESENESSH